MEKPKEECKNRQQKKDCCNGKLSAIKYMMENDLPFQITESKPHNFIIDIDLASIDSEHLGNIIMCLQLSYPQYDYTKEIDRYNSYG